MLELNVHGYRIKIDSESTSSESTKLLQRLEFDFFQFKDTESDGQSQKHLEIRLRKALSPPWFKIPILRRRGLVRFWCPGPKAYFWKPHAYQASLILRPVRTLDVVFEDLECAHENLYLFLLSTIGEFLEERGWHRLHAVAYRRLDTAFVIPLDSGRGKSTFASWLLQNTDAALFGDETLFTDGVQVWPFPIRRARRPADSRDSVKQLEPWPRGRVSLEPAPIEIILFQDQYSLVRFFWTFFWGLGNAQMMEYLVRLDTAFWLFKVASRRILVFLKLSSRIKCVDAWSENPEINFEKLQKLKKDS